MAMLKNQMVNGWFAKFATKKNGHVEKHDNSARSLEFLRPWSVSWMDYHLVIC